MLVDALTGASADAGSIPAASIIPAICGNFTRAPGEHLPLGAFAGLLDALRLGERVHRALEVGLVVVSVDSRRRRRVGVAEQVLDDADVGMRAADVGREGMAGPVHV